MIFKHPLAVWILAPILILGLAMTCVAPRAMAPLFIAVSILGLAGYAIRHKAWPAFDRPLAMLFGGLIVFGLLSTLWSINAGETPGKALQLAAIFGPMVCLVPLIRQLETVQLRILGYCAGLGAVLGGIVYLSELHSGYVLWDLVRGGGPTSDPIDAKQNKPAVLLALWMYMAFPFLAGRGRMVFRFLYLAAIPALVYITFASKSATAQLILTGASFLGVALYVLPVRISLFLTLVVSVFLTASMPFIARGVYDYTPWQSKVKEWGTSVLSRIEIWNQASDRAMEKPVLGWGLDSAPKLPNRDDRSLIYAEHPSISHLHPHNGPIQIWFELGAVGIAFVLALYVLLARRIRAFTSAPAQKYALYMWAMTFLYTLSIWGIWQSWFVATLAFTGLMGYAGARYLELTES